MGILRYLSISPCCRVLCMVRRFLWRDKLKNSSRVKKEPPNVILKVLCRSSQPCRKAFQSWILNLFWNIRNFNLAFWRTLEELLVVVCVFGTNLSWLSVDALEKVFYSVRLPSKARTFLRRQELSSKQTYFLKNP